MATPLINEFSLSTTVQAERKLPTFAKPSDRALSSAADGFQVYQRGVSAAIPVVVLDDSVSVFLPDTLGIIGETTIDEFLGVTDLVNGDNTTCRN